MNMTNLISYLTFNGNCREAMIFYQKCLGGELNLQTVGDSPLAEALPERMKECILHASLRNGRVQLMATDMVGEHGLRKGNSVSILINCTSEAELYAYFEQLSKGGRQTHPIEYTFWGALFGSLTDRFGNQWLFTFSEEI